MTRAAAGARAAEGARHAPRVEEIACPLCGSRQAATRWRSRDRLTGVPGDYQIVQCGRCSFLYQNPRPTPADLHLCYPEDYGAYHPSAAEGHKLFRGSKREVDANRLVLASRFGYTDLAPENPSLAVRLVAVLQAPRVRKLVFPMRGEGRLLDVGCSTGARMSSLKSLGWTVWGIENAPEAGEQARRVHGSVFVGDALDAPFPDASFDMVTCFHVLEHVPDPRGLMSRMVRWLAPGGVCVVEVPNGGSLGARLFGTYWYLLDLPRHLHHFTPETLTRLARECGGAVRRLQHRDSLGSWVGSLGFWDDERARVEGRPSRQLDKKRWLKKALKPFGYAARFARRGEILRAFIERESRATP